MNRSKPANTEPAADIGENPPSQATSGEVIGPYDTGRHWSVKLTIRHKRAKSEASSSALERTQWRQDESVASDPG